MTPSSDVNLGDLVEVPSALGGSHRGIVIAVARNQGDLDEMGFGGLKLAQWPSVDPLLILVNDEPKFWIGERVTVLSRFDATVG